MNVVNATELYTLIVNFMYVNVNFTTVFKKESSIKKQKGGGQHPEFRSTPSPHLNCWLVSPGGRDVRVEGLPLIFSLS